MSENFGFDGTPIIQRFSLSDMEIEPYLYSIPYPISTVEKPFIATECHYDTTNHRYVKCIPGSGCCGGMGLSMPHKKFGVVILKYKLYMGGKFSFSLHPWTMNRKQFEEILKGLDCDFKLQVVSSTPKFGGGGINKKSLEFARVILTPPHSLGITDRKNMWKDKGAIEDQVEKAYPKVYAELKNWMTYSPYVNLNNTLLKEPIPFSKLVKGGDDEDFWKEVQAAKPYKPFPEDSPGGSQSFPKPPSKFIPSTKKFWPKEGIPDEPQGGAVLDKILDGLDEDKAKKPAPKFKKPKEPEQVVKKRKIEW